MDIGTVTVDVEREELIELIGVSTIEQQACQEDKWDPQGTTSHLCEGFPVLVEEGLR